MSPWLEKRAHSTLPETVVKLCVKSEHPNAHLLLPQSWPCLENTLLHLVSS